LASAEIDGEHQQLISDEVPEHGGARLDVSIPIAAIRDAFRRHAELRGFFINAHPDPESVEPDDVKSGVKRLEKWFASEKPGPLVGLPTGHRDDTEPAFEFDWVIFVLIDACIEHLERDLKNDPDMKKAGITFTGDDGDRNEAWHYDSHEQVAAMREKNGYQPSEAFLKEYLALFSSSPAFVAAWAKTIAELPEELPSDGPRFPHPLADLDDATRARLTSKTPKVVPDHAADDDDDDLDEEDESDDDEE
jgi:hypothetical protein